jgi:hypothetical protein
MMTYFSDHFELDPDLLRRHGAFDISLVTDLPLFVDPFLLFNSKRKEYRMLHDEMIKYLEFLRDKADRGVVDPGLVDVWYRFPEVRQNWFGFTHGGNRGSGLGKAFALALHENLHRLFRDFGKEQITKGSHLEKLCLIREGVGRDNISDFTTNLIKGFLCEYTQEFALKYLRSDQRHVVTVPKVSFNYQTETWQPERYELPWANGDYIVLTPKDILTRDDTWINKRDLFGDFEDLPAAIPNEALRAQVNNYFRKVLVHRRDKEPTKTERAEAARRTLLWFPQLIDYYIKKKEESGDKAEHISSQKVRLSEQLYVAQIQALQATLAKLTDFYGLAGDTYNEAHQRVKYLKDVVEDKGGHRIFYANGKPIERESDIHILYQLVWYGTPSDVSREVNDGRGPADFKISRGAKDKTIVEFKLAKNTHLPRNLKNQAEIYQRASDAKNAIKVIFFFSNEERTKLTKILKGLGLYGHHDIIMIDARNDNKPSGSKA